MTNDDPIARALTLPAGAVFHRCALQVNPHHYGGTFRGQDATGDATTHAQAIFDTAVALGISVLAITDHNDVSGVPAFRALEELSTGQKATMVLLLLLLESDAPLIVDQTEDGLDNRFITEGVVPRMRNEKQRRQFIFSTHNANIPVLGDAELIVGLSASGEAEHGRARIAPEHMGSIDTQPVRELEEEILEGGKEAFERRRRKYGF